MPKSTIDYQNYYFYKIVCNNINVKDAYVGGTANFNCRKANHKIACNYPSHSRYNYKLYKIIRENGGWDNWSMVLIEKANCADGLEARKRERELFEQHSLNMNNNTPSRTPNEYAKFYYENNKEKVKLNLLKYRQAHKEAYNAYQKAYRLKVKNDKMNNPNIIHNLT
jgi:hypothetical protein